MTSRNLFAFAVLACCSTLLAADAPRVFDAGKQPDDRRLELLHDVDHPVVFTPQFKDAKAWEQHAKALREQVLVAEGLWPMPEKLPLKPVIHGKIDRDAYTVEKVFFASYPGHYVSGNLYRPKTASGKVPAVLCPHGHWANGRFYERSDAEAKKQIDEGAETTMEGAKYPIQARCAMLARMGCVVFQYDMVGYADSQAIPHRTGFTDTESILRLQSFMGLQSWNTIRALDFVTSLPEVDASRIAVTGASGGGTQTIIISAIDDRPTVVFPAVMVSEAMQGGCICENAPLLRVGTNNVELIGTFAPKPLAMSAANDWTIALETDGLPKLQTIYGLFGAKDRVAGKHFFFEHNYNQHSREMMYDWFNKYLKLGQSSPVKEQPWQPVPPKELSVYDEQHPRPEDTADAATLRKQMTAASDKQLDDLFQSDPKEYRRIVRTALRVMVHDQLPPAGLVEVSRSSGPQAGNHLVIETGALGRKGTGEAIPFVSIVPEDWSGSVVVWVDPVGKQSLFDQAGKLSQSAQELVDAKNAIVSADVFTTGEFEVNGKLASLPSTDGYAKQKYAGFYFGYNRGVLANQAHDLLTEIEFVRQWKGIRQVNLIATGKPAIAALLARSLSGKAVDRAALDLAGFDFEQVTDGKDPMLLPGGIKYGGVYGLAALCNSGQTMLCNGPKGSKPDRAAATSQVTLHAEAMPVAQMLHWLAQPN